MKNVVCFGEILWDNFPSGKEPGGAPMNVAIQLSNQGFDSTLISAVGNDLNGRELITYLEHSGLDTSFVQVNAALPTGVVDVLLDAEGKATYTIAQPVAWDAIGFDRALSRLVAGADAIVFGSLICRDKRSRDTLFRVLDHARLKVFDLNLRPPHVSPEDLLQLLQMSSVLKVNDEELVFLKTLFRLEGSVDDLLDELSARFGLECICVTFGGQGAIAWHNGKQYRHPGYQVKVADTVGSGDAFLASFLAGYLCGYSFPEILNKACAVGAFVASRPGANPQYVEEEVIKIARSQK